jgi:serine/threonine-protein kinase
MVFHVQDIASGCSEAMKVIRLQPLCEPLALDRLRREIRVQASIHHPHIAKLNSATVTPAFALIFMELVDGPSLARRLTFGALPVRQALRYATQVTSALERLHESGIIHRDIKPSNIVVSSAGVAKLLDFGIVRPVDSQLTAIGQVLGTLQYMSPEQIHDSSNVDCRSDVYSTGVTLYELVTGILPFDGVDARRLIAAHLEARPAPPRELNSSIHPALSETILKAISENPEDRFQTAKELRVALEDAIATTAALA